MALAAAATAKLQFPTALVVAVQFLPEWCTIPILWSLDIISSFLTVSGTYENNLILRLNFHTV